MQQKFKTITNMNVKDALFELKHGHRIAHRGIATPDGRITYLMDFKNNDIEVTQLKGRELNKWHITKDYFVENHKDCDFEIYD